MSSDNDVGPQDPPRFSMTITITITITITNQSLIHP